LASFWGPLRAPALFHWPHYGFGLRPNMGPGGPLGNGQNRSPFGALVLGPYTLCGWLLGPGGAPNRSVLGPSGSTPPLGPRRGPLGPYIATLAQEPPWGCGLLALFSAPYESFGLFLGTLLAPPGPPRGLGLGFGPWVALPALGALFGPQGPPGPGALDPPGAAFLGPPARNGALYGPRTLFGPIRAPRAPQGP